MFNQVETAMLGETIKKNMEQDFDPDKAVEAQGMVSNGYFFASVA